MKSDVGLIWDVMPFFVLVKGRKNKALIEGKIGLIVFGEFKRIIWIWRKESLFKWK